MPEIYCQTLKEYIAVEGGASLIGIARNLRDRLGFEPICARVNNKIRSMEYTVYRPRTVEFLGIGHPAAERTYIRSLCMMLYRAVCTVVPGAHLSICHSISNGYYCRLEGCRDCTPELVDALRAEMQRLADSNLPFERCEALTDDVLPIFEAQQMQQKILLLRTSGKLFTTYYRLDGVCDSYYGPLMPRTGLASVFDLRQYKDGFILVGYDHTIHDVPPQHVTQEKMYRAFTDYVAFNHIAGVSTVGELNVTVDTGRAADLVNVTEALHEKALAHISDDITARYRAGGAPLFSKSITRSST